MPAPDEETLEGFVQVWFRGLSTPLNYPVRATLARGPGRRVAQA